MRIAIFLLLFAFSQISLPGQQPCEIYNLVVETGDCNNDGTYNAWIDFDVDSPTNDSFTVWANNNSTQLGTWPLTALPLQIAHFPTDGGDYDKVKVCILGNNDCCRIKEFLVPDCVGPCEIYDLTVTTGDCLPNTLAYAVTINFGVHNPTNASFDLWGNNQLIGTYPLTSLPLTIAQFNSNGGPNDVIKVCINDNPNCCKIKEFPVPDCLGNSDPCEIYDLVVETGDCNADGTYNVWLNFEVQNPGNNFFEVWANGNTGYLGIFPLDSLPLHIAHFPTDGGPNDFLKVCINDQPNCCKLKEFPVPDCAGTDPCEIYDLVVETGDCGPNGTYNLWLDFEVQNPGNDFFEVWANNGQYLGIFPLSGLPLHIENFPTNGGANDVVKVCINDHPDCCKIEEFPVPDCVGNTDPCHIFDAHAVVTPCLCGQFFALVSFEFANTGNDGFDITGNGVNYGTWPYNTPQPIILGPFEGDSSTNFVFVVKDHNHPDCADEAVLGLVDCYPNLSGVFSSDENENLVFAPNPATDKISVMAKLAGNQAVGQAKVEIFQADGKQLRNLIVSDGGNFTLDVSDFPAGIYKARVLGDSGIFEGRFVKQ